MRATVLCLAALAMGACAHHTRGTAKERARSFERDARAAAIEWLELLDAHDYEAAYDAEPARLRAGGTARQFVRSMKSRRAPFGRTITRRFIGAAHSRKLTGAPDGDYESLLFRTSFQHKTLAAERLILTNERGIWRVVDYRLY